MKTILFLLLFPIFCKAQSDTLITKADSVNIRQLKQIIVFTGEVKRAWDGLIEVWYIKDRKNSIPSEKSFLNTLDKIASKL